MLKKKNTRSLEVYGVVSCAKQLSYALGRRVHVVYNSMHHGLPKPTCLVVFMVTVITWFLGGQNLYFHGLGGSWHPDLSISTCTNACRTLGWIHQSFG